MVFDFTSKLPKEMQSQILNELDSADFAATLTAASLGRYNESEAATVLSSVAKNYAEALAKSLGNAYANALGDYVSLKGGEGLIGDTAAWSMLTDRVQDNINKMFKDIGAQIKGGDTEGGLKAINDINSVIDNTKYFAEYFKRLSIEYIPVFSLSYAWFQTLSKFTL